MSIDKQIENFEERPIRALYKWAVIAIGLAFVLAIGGFILRPVDMAVERAVLVTSHQYKEGMEQRANILQANIAEIDAMLVTNPENRAQLMAQKRALTAQYNATLRD